ncbi:MAG: hypothetical protein ACKOEO_18315 [Planctomycetaceae bacterium]
MTADSPWRPTSLPPSTQRSGSRLLSPFVVIPALTVLHSAVFLATVLISYGASMDAFETGKSQSGAAVIAGSINRVLQLPLIPLAQNFGPTGRWGFVIVLTNSLLWATVSWLLLRRFTRRSSQQR